MRKRRLLQNLILILSEMNNAVFHAVPRLSHFFFDQTEFLHVFGETQTKYENYKNE